MSDREVLMVTIQVHRPGTIDWLGLSTPDREGSALFYSDLLDWGIVRYETGAGPFLTAEVRGRDAAGILQPQPTIGDMTLPATWTVFIRVDDLEESLLLLSDLGGRIIERPREIPELGRSAVVADPSGAVFSLAAFHPDFGLAVRDEPGALTWCDLLTRDPVTAVAFYTSLFGWGADRDETTGYIMFRLDGAPVAGMMAMPAEVPEEAPSHWLPYFGVADCEKSARRLEELGGTINHGPQRIGIGSFAIAEDPFGASFAILEHVDPTIGRRSTLNSDVLPKVRMHLELESEGESVTATAVLDGFGEPFHASGSAAQSRDRDPARPNLAAELAVVRALSDLHHQILERVHERIDRSMGDI